MNFAGAYFKNESVLIKIILICILIASGALVLRNVGHSGITYWDEGFHAVVARNLTKHPLKFTLYDQPWLPYNYKGWGENHIWLHKPPVAMWSIWLSHLVFGINTFALRLPSAISLVVTTWLTFRIAADLFDKRTGLIAAFLNAFNPFLFESVHGYRYSDHIDIALLLWVQVSCWFLLRAIRTGKRRNYILSGVTMGIAYLSKSYLALITFGIALVVWCVARGKQIYRQKHPSDTTIQSEKTEAKIRLRDIGVQLLAAIATVAPWVIYCLIYYRKEFLWEHKRVLDHLNTDVESWGASWDRPLFDYMPLFYPLFYAALVAAVLCLLVVLFRHWNLAELFVLAWGIGVIVPHTLAETKTPSATMIAVPPLLICLAAVISRAWQRKDWIYTAIWTAGMFAITIISGGRTLVKGRDQFDGLKKIAPFIETNFWIVEQLIGFGVLLAIFAGVYMLIRAHNLQRWIWLGLRTVALIIALFYAGHYVYAAYKVTERNYKVPLYETSGQRLQGEIPKNACFFLDDERVGAHFDLMYYADRSTYQIYNKHMKEPRDFEKQAEIAREAGAIPYLFSVKDTDYNYPLFTEGEVDIGNGKMQRYRVYEITETQE
ncbi:MAG: glycosyltransferase family 39 protein [Candidatus Poribacteria bacterium]|nr:glycosyltransferase family 39 protein [Candidatus Poribacteria bacterium]